MADAEHLALLKSGVGEWNDWRANNPRKETLRGADLSGANLSWARLSGADLSGTNLSGARLNLRRAKSSGAKFSRAELSGIVADLNLPCPAIAEEPAVETLPRTAVEPEDV